ncbi:MAG: glycosyltransferase family 2 protein [Proteobacteria bacterium]|nr:glycosyltransferase family 2 protein [Pseudomonadota bacterium]
MTPDQRIVAAPELSVVVPAFNEAEGIGAFLERLADILRGCCSAFEIWVIDDGSRDATWEQLRAAQQHLPELRGVRFTRNFGKEAAILAGLRQARGRAVIVMDADGQHPPGLLPQMLAPWRDGRAQIVAAQKVTRDGDGWRARCAC